MGGVDLVLFDIDGTLLNSGGRVGLQWSPPRRISLGIPRDVRQPLIRRRCGLRHRGSRADRRWPFPDAPRRMGRMRSTYARRLTRDLFANPGARCPGVPDVVHRTREVAKVGLLTGNWPEWSTNQAGCSRAC